MAPEEADDAGGAPSPASRGSSTRRTLRAPDDAPLLGGNLVLLVPLVVLEAAVLFAPLVYVFVRSFYDWQPGGVSTYIGMENYAILFADPEFWQVVGNQLFYLLGLPLWVAAPLVVAFLLREHVRGAGFFRSVYFFPAVMSPAIVGLVFRSLLSTGGPLDTFLNNIGLGWLSLPWLTSEYLVKPVIIVLVLWAGFGTGVLIFAAALGAVPQDIFDAARLDGVGFWREFWHIAIPSIRPTIVLWIMFQIISIFLFMFSWIYVLTGGGPGLASTTLDFSIYQQFMRFGFFGTAAAESVVLVIFILLVPLVLGVIPRVIRGIAGRGRTQSAGMPR